MSFTALGSQGVCCSFRLCLPRLSAVSHSRFLWLLTCTFDSKLTNALGSPVLILFFFFFSIFWLSWTIFLQPILLQDMKSMYKLDSISITSLYAFQVLQRKHSFKVKGAWPTSSHVSIWVKLLHGVKFKQFFLYNEQWPENAAGGLNSIWGHIPMEQIHVLWAVSDSLGFDGFWKHTCPGFQF